MDRGEIVSCFPGGLEAGEIGVHDSAVAFDGKDHVMLTEIPAIR